VTSVVVAELAISLELGHDSPCLDLSGPLYRQMSGGAYDKCSVMALPLSLEEWRAEHATARKRADKAQRLGYRFVNVIRDRVADEIFAINTSIPIRQGRAMSPGYLEKPPTTPDPLYPCERHGVHPYGVEAKDGTLVAYVWIYRSGQLCLVSQILGHADHLEHGIMYLLWQGMLTSEPPDNGYLVYNRWDSGGDGLRFYKTRVGLVETAVRWVA
jgi:hypothetical protein